MLAWVLNLGFAASEVVVVIDDDVDFEYVAVDNRMEYMAVDNPFEYVASGGE